MVRIKETMHKAFSKSRKNNTKTVLSN